MTQTPWDDVIQAVADREAPQVGWTGAQLAALVRAHMAVESGFSPTAYHWDGPDAIRNVSRGVMQIEGATAIALGLDTGADSDTQSGPDAPRDFGTTTVPERTTGMYDPYIAIPVGIRIIRENLARANGNVAQAIAAYNEGPSRAAQDAGTGSYRDQAYVDRVQARFAQELDVPPPPEPPSAAGTDVTVKRVLLGIGIVLVGWYLQRTWS